MSLYKTFKTDAEMEQDGIWLDYGTDGKIRVARAGGSNLAFAKSLQRHTASVKSALKNETLDDETQKAIMIEVYADSVVLEWDGVKDENDEILPFNRANVVKVLTDLPDLFADIRESAGKMTLFRRALLVEAAAKN